MLNNIQIDVCMCVLTRVHVTVWVCVCSLYFSGCHFSADPINPPIFRTFSSLWLLQTFGRLSCVVVWKSHPKNLCSRRVPLIPSCRFKRQTFPHLQPSHVNLCVCVCLLSLMGPLFIPQGDHRQLNSIQSSCHLFLPSFTSKGQNSPLYGTLSVTFNSPVTILFHAQSSFHPNSSHYHHSNNFLLLPLPSVKLFF